MKQYFGTVLLSLLTCELGVASAGRVRDRQVTVTQTVTGTPAQSTPYDWAAGAVTKFPIHPSCNATQRALLTRALGEAVQLAEHAKQHVLRFGNSSEFYTKYFGKAPTAEVIGWYERIVSADKAGIWFRCDDIDGNCRTQSGWAGHWRGSNATDETVICELSYTARRPLEGLCGYGWKVASGSLNLFFGSDLIHRLYHMPKVGEAIVEHYADGYVKSLELAKTRPNEAVRNSHTLQYFALDVYAYDISLPGEGCTGKPVTSASVSAATSTATSARSVATGTSTARDPCHTHDDGQVHCV